MTASLGTCADPRELIDGDAEAAQDLAEQLRARTAVLDGACAAVMAIEPAGVWQGQAAQTLTGAVQSIATRLDAAAGTYQQAASVLDGYAGEVRSARVRAASAVELWEQGRRATALAQASYQQTLHRVQSASSPLNEAKGSARTSSVSVSAFVDPGESLREEAMIVLAAAQRADAQAAEQTSGVIRNVSNSASDDQSFWDGVGGHWSEMWHDAGDFGADTVNGLASGVMAIGEEPWSFIEGLAGTILMGLGAGGEVLGFGLDATGIGAALGVPAGAVAAGAITAGGAMAAAGAGQLAEAAAGDAAVTLMNGPSRGSSSGSSSGSSGNAAGSSSGGCLPESKKAGYVDALTAIGVGCGTTRPRRRRTGTKFGSWIRPTDIQMDMYVSITNMDNR